MIRGASRPVVVSQRPLPIISMLGQLAATVSILFAVGLAAVVGAIFGTFTIFLVNPIYHWITGEWMASVVFGLAISFWAVVIPLALLKAIIEEKFAAGENRFIPYLSLVLDEFSSALKITGLFSTLVALGGPFVALAAFFEVFKNGVTVHEAFVLSFLMGGAFSLIEICKLAYRKRLRDRPKDMAYFRGKAENFRKKAEAVSEPGLKAAFETVAREYMAKAQELDPLFLRTAEIDSPQAAGGDEVSGPSAGDIPPPWLLISPDVQRLR
jgi:hypothetical protein